MPLPLTETLLYACEDLGRPVDRGKASEVYGSVYGEILRGPGRSIARFSVGLKMEPCLRRRRKKKIPRRMRATPATPPTTPPTMAPVLLECEDEVGEAVDEAEAVDVELGDAEEELVAF